MHNEAGLVWYFWTHLRWQAFVFRPNDYRSNIWNTRILGSSFWEYSWLEIESLETSLGIMIDFVVILNWEGLGCAAVWLPMMQLSSAEVSWKPRTAQGYWTGKGAAVLFRSVGSATFVPSWCNCSMQAGWRMKSPANTLLSMIWIDKFVSHYLCIFFRKLLIIKPTRSTNFSNVVLE